MSLAENFTVTYRSEHKDTTTVTVRSATDPAGFTLTLEETTSISHTFVATFKTADATLVTGSSDPTSSTRPTIKVSDGDTVTLEYADASPSKLISEAVIVDATKPSVSITAPAHDTSTSNSTAWARVIVTDSASGVELSQIKFHVDVDRDTVFDEPGEIIVASAIDSTAINQGWNAMVLLPPIGTDGPVEWYVTATDRSSNVGRSDSESTAGDQDHTSTVDTSPPALSEVVLGESWNSTDEKIVGNVLNSIRVKWSEPIKESLVDATRFYINGESAKTATIIPNPSEAVDISDAVWLTFEDIPTSPQLLTMFPGAVFDLTEFPNELKEIIPRDMLGPRLTVSTDTAITNGLLTIIVTTVETLTAAPTVTINGVTFGSAQPVDTNVWAIIVGGTTFTGSAAGDGVKNVEAAAFDAALNIARGGVPVGATGYPTGAIQFHLDTVIKDPIVLPGDREISLVSRPLLTVSFAEEIGEYSGDTHAGVTIISATLDGNDVTSEFTAESASTWSFRPSDLTNTEHTLEVVGRDDAGNTHSPIVRVFSVDAPDPTPTPVPTETPTPLPIIDSLPTVEVAPAEVPSDSGDATAAVPETIPPQADSESGADPDSAASVEPVPPPGSNPDSENTEPEASDPDAEEQVEPEQAPSPSDPGDPDDPESPPAEDGDDAEVAPESEDDAEVSEGRPDEANLTEGTIWPRP